MTHKRPRPLLATALLALCLNAPAALFATDTTNRVAEADALVRENFTTAAALYTAMLDDLAHRRDDGIPRTLEAHENRLVTVKPSDWTAGFFAGSLWYLYEQTRDEKWQRAARTYTERLEAAQHDTTTHDVGFILYCAYGNGLRITGDPAYRGVLLRGADSLSTRFNPAVGALRSWDPWGRLTWRFPVIIDNMMNLELLAWATRTSGSPRYLDIAVAHAHATLRNHFRQDGSSYHLVDYDPESGAVLRKQTYQGYANESSWARGQAWALYGFSLMYRETRNPVYLAQARKTAFFILTHPRLPADKIPYWDFDAPDIPRAPRDTSAAAVIASALVELSAHIAHIAPDEAAAYLDAARSQLLTLSSPAYRAAPGENGNFILKHATGFFSRNIEVDAPLNYGDYYFLEALLRYQAALKK